jgi:hypothetical protein
MRLCGECVTSFVSRLSWNTQRQLQNFTQIILMANLLLVQVIINPCLWIYILQQLVSCTATA